ncbi:hypothetical protein KGY79_10700, partial [Candidatus Bipolaricaulota bacterium]|nr:hypothetical protein [Candidatus Bipolaricaulota bacterium]
MRVNRKRYLLIGMMIVSLVIGGTLVWAQETEGPVHIVGTNQYFNSIQNAINAANEDDTIEVEPGIYEEEAYGLDRGDGKPAGMGLFIEDKTGLTIVGVDENGEPIEDVANVVATIKPVPEEDTLAGWGPFSYFVTECSSDITFQGLEFLEVTEANSYETDPNKNFEIEGDNVAIKHSIIDGPSGSIYFNKDGVQSFELIENEIKGSVSINSGAGNDLDKSNRVITDNILRTSFVIQGDVQEGYYGSGWLNDESGAATLEDNTFTGSGYVLYTYGDNLDQPWEDYFTKNDFIEGSSLSLKDADNWEPRASSNFRVIWTDIQTSIDAYASDGDTIKVGPGTYKGPLTIEKSLSLHGTGGGVELTTTEVPSGNHPTLQITADGTVVKNLEIEDPGDPEGNPTDSEHGGIFVGDPSGYNDINDESITLKNIVIGPVKGNKGDNDGPKTAEGIHVKAYNTGDPINGVNIKNNLIQDVNQPDYGANGIKLQADVNDVNIEGNTIQNISGSWEWGITLTHSFGESGVPNNVHITRNVIQDLGLGLGIGGNSDKGFAGARAHFNSIKNVDYGLITSSPDPINATLNWWGITNGPSAFDLQGDSVYAGGGSPVVGNVVFSPWLGDSLDEGTGIDTDSDTPGVQLPKTVNIIVDDVGPKPTTENSNEGYLNQAIWGSNDLPGTDIINVREGTYLQEGTEGIEDSVVIFGPNAGINPSTGTRSDEAIIDPVQDSDGNFPAEAFKIATEDLGTIVVDGFKVNGGDEGGIIQHWEDSEDTTVHVWNNIVNVPEGGWDEHGNSIQVCGSGSTVVGNQVGATNYSFEESEWATSGILVYKGSNIVVENNLVEYVPEGISGNSNNGIAVGRFITPDPAEDNVVRANTVRGAERGIDVLGNVENTVVAQNVIKNNEVGTSSSNYNYYDENGDLVDFGGVPSGTEIHYNSIVGNETGVRSYAEEGFAVELLDATLNWWGDASGSEHATHNPDGTGDAVSDNVIFSPWLGDSLEDGTGIDTEPDTPGVQLPNGVNIIVDDVGPTKMGYLNRAIWGANSEYLYGKDTIKVRQGIYDTNSSETIDESVTILGPNSANSPNEDTWDGATEATIKDSEIKIGNGATDVEVAGLTFTGSGNSILNPPSSQNSANVKIFHNLFQDKTSIPVANWVAQNPQYSEGINWVIHNNRFENIIGNSNSAMFLTNSTGFNITENVISGAGFAGMNLDTIKDFTVANNYIENTGRHGIQVANSPESDTVITQNTITNTVTDQVSDDG